MADELIFNEPSPSPIYFGDPTDIGTVKNSDGTYSVNVHSGVTVLPDIDFTDSDGVTSLVPSVKDIVATPHHGADVENSDGSYTAHVNDAATLVVPDSAVTNTDNTYVFPLPATQPHVVPDSNINNSDSSYHVSLPAAQPIVIPDSVVSNSDDTYIVNVPATNSLELPDITVTRKDANGQPIVTAYPAAKNYTEAGSIPDANGWIRPADWLPISHLVTDGEEKVAALYAVWDAAGIAQGYNNYCALLVRGAYTVDWGDGTIENFADNVQAEHEYVYANMPASSYCSRGYRQAIITITPQAVAHLTLLNFSRKHTLNAVKYCTNNFLDVQISGTDIYRIMMYESTYSICKMLERFYAHQTTGALTNVNTMLYNCTSLYSINILNLNVINVITSASVFQNCLKIEYLNLSTLNIPLSTTLNAYISSCRSLKILIININNNLCTTINSLVSSCESLQYLSFVNPDITSVLDASYLFSDCRNLQIIDLSLTNMAACTSNAGIISSNGSLYFCRLPQIGRTFSVANNKLDTANLNLLFTDLRNLNGSISTITRTTGNYGTGYAVGDLIQINGGNNDARIKVLTLSGSAVATYQLMVAGTGYTVAGALTTTAITGGGSGLKIDVTALVATQTITITGNPGAGTCNQAIATAKNWIVVN